MLNTLTSSETLNPFTLNSYAERASLLPIPGVSHESSYAKEYKLIPNAPSLIDATRAIEPENTSGGLTGLDAPIVCALRFGPDYELMIVDTRRDQRFSTPMLIVSKDHFKLTDDYHDSGYKGLRYGETVTMGRHHHAERDFGYPSSVSRTHASIFLREDNVLEVTDLSSGGTRVSGFLLKESVGSNFYHRLETEANYTKFAQEKAELLRRYGSEDGSAPHGYFREHPIIGRESLTVKNGVYFTSNSEAVLVDGWTEPMQMLERRFLNDLARGGEIGEVRSSEDTLRFISQATSLILKYDVSAMRNLCQPYFDDNEIIGLSEFVRAGVGVCRQQALLAALMFEWASDHGLVSGTVHVERNIDSAARAGHAWAVHVAFSGKETVVDPTNGYVGPRESSIWNYHLGHRS